MKKPEIKKDVIALRESWRSLPDYGCFWSSPDNPRGLRLTPRIEPGKISVEMEIEREHSGFPGIAHGGIAYTIVDGLMGWYIMAHEGRAGFTTQTTTQYKATLKVGERYLFEVTRAADGEDSGTGKTYLIGKVFNASDSSRTALVEIQAKFILPNRALARKVLGPNLGAHGEELFPEN